MRLLAPFDPIVWERRRFEHLWGWDYRFEAYTKPEQRRFGYYAMPLLWGYDDHRLGQCQPRPMAGWTRISASSARGRPDPGVPPRARRRTGGDGEFPDLARRPEMPPKIGYLLPTREQIMEGRPDAASLLALAARAEALGYNSVWVGNSVLARPRHDPLTLLAGVAGRVPRVALGTAVLLPALRNPVLLAHQVATLDQVSEGRFILGVGIARDVPNIRAEFAACGVPFEKRVGRMMEGLRLCRALWTGEAVDWDGRWPVHGRRAGAGAVPPGRPADLDRRQHAGEPGAGGQVVRRLVPQRAGCGGVRAAVGRGGSDRPGGGARSVAAVGGDVPDADGG